MEVLVTGATGFIGTSLTNALRGDGHRVVPVSRPSSRPGGGEAVAWDPAAGTIDATAMEGFDAVVHLAGEPIAALRWTAAKKKRIHDSRTRGTSFLARTLASLQRPPKVLVSGSAVGYYGSRGDDVITEDSDAGDDFLAHVCADWEDATRPAQDAGIRVVRVRTGLVLDPDGGLLGKLLLPFRLGIGGRIGSGRQWMPWITLQDEVRAMTYALTTDELSGPVNLAAPRPVTNAEFTATLARVIHRPAVVPVPLGLVSLVTGKEVVAELLAVSQRAIPARLEKSGFEFHDTELEPALRRLLA